MTATAEAWVRVTAVRPLRAGLAAGIGVLIGIAIGFLLITADWVALASAVVIAFILMGATRLVPAPQRQTAMSLVALAYVAHVAVLAALHVALVGIGLDGFVTGDDREYARLSYGLAELFRGNPSRINWQADGYLVGTFVYLEALVFYLVGPSVLTMKVLNAGFAVGAALLAFDWARRVFDSKSATVAAALVAVFPSVLIWSSLNLKDALAILLICGVLWAVLRFQLSPSAVTFLLPFAMLLPLESLRNYIFVGLALVVPVAVALVPKMTLREKTAWTGAAMIASGGLIALSLAPEMGSSASLLQRLEDQRAAMAVGARTAFVETAIVRTEEGQVYIIATPAPSPGTGATTRPGPTPVPAIVHVSPNTRIVVAATDVARSPSPLADTVVVRPGDIVVVGESSGTAVSSPMPLLIPQGKSVQVVSSSEGEGARAQRTLQYLPRGLAYALLAPFPWALERRADLLTLPDMLLWYVIAAAAAITVLSRRSVIAVVIPAALFVVGTLFVFALAEGNVGTLYRHRAMVIPATAMLAAPTLVALAPRLARALRVKRAR